MKFDNLRLIVVVRAVIVGLFVGIVISLFRWFVEHIRKITNVIYHLAGNNIWILALTILGMFVLTWVIAKIVQPNERVMGSGIPQVEGQLHGELEMEGWSTLWRKFVATTLTLGTGVFLGREGPSIQLGASVGQVFAEQMELDKRDWRLLIASGAAAGISAAFSAPIAGTMFVLEEVYHSLAVTLWISALSASLTADLVSQQAFGLKPILSIVNGSNVPPRYYWLVVVVGILAGLFAIFFQKMILWQPTFYKIFKWIPRKYQAIVPLLLVIPIGIYFTDLLGGSNALIVQITEHTPGMWVLLGILVLRFVFTMISYGSGLSGGIFFPILTIGSVFGALFGLIAVNLGLLPKEFVSDFVVFAMAGYFAGISKAPFTAVLLLTEMVGSMSQLLPIALVALISYLTVDAFGGKPIYESLLARMVAGTKKITGLYGRTDEIRVTVNPGGLLEETAVRDIKWPTGSLLTNVSRGQEELVPDGDLLLHHGDILTIVMDKSLRSNATHEIAAINN